MTAKMLRFVTLGRAMPEKRGAELRRHDFDEIYREFRPEEAANQASRCSQCGVPFCQVHCPVHNNIPDWLKLAAEGRLEEAYETSSATNNFPEICGRICPQDRLCEGNCVIEQAGHGTVTIGAIEKFITDTAWEKGWVKPVRPRRERRQSIGIVGAGPAGLAAAEELRRQGYQVTVYDRYDRAGGLLIYGIPAFKLEKEVVQRRAALLVEAGVTFTLNFEVGRDASLEELRRRHDAILIACGVYKARDIQAPGVGLHNIVPALDYLTASNRSSLGDHVPAFASGALDARGKNVVVIGGGDTAMDCVRTAVRQGALSVKCLYRRDRANMPGSQREVAHAEEEGVEFVWLAQPEAFVGGSGNADPYKLTGLRAQRIHLGIADATGRQQPRPIEGSHFHLPADLAIKALGFDPENLPEAMGAPGLELTRWGSVKLDWKRMATNLEGVFAAGDIVRGASLVVWAIRDGRDAAAAIQRYLMAKEAGLSATAAE
ncbi:MAG TPA: NAD(P)-dependent oxidoreductase [Hypericibacter adhaerens]|uniref:NAD(P)-dependent oxidoreductase n=1 Tax=Hypericibacter adhaerens TaxID=2602016 RepID=UPI002B80FA18|nr:NAD(P)-dependent oxidoreductase [Hypericibacter adhaerens]HWA41827.1 NAD(P)-dependent oxidoreductase [Hypericibacter adhaerens]